MIPLGSAQPAGRSVPADAGPRASAPEWPAPPPPVDAPALPAEPSVSFSLLGGRYAGDAARRAVIEAGAALPEAAHYDVLLLVTELVTNAVSHGAVGPDQELRVELRIGPGRVRVTLTDLGRSFTWARPRASSDSDGWALLLVDRLADRWGITRTPSGTRVWFEMAFEA